MVSDGGVAGVQNDDPRLSPPAGHSTRRSATAAGKYHHEVNKIFIKQQNTSYYDN